MSTKKMSPARNAFENRVGQVILAFSALANIGVALVKDLAKGWFNKITFFVKIVSKPSRKTLNL